MSSHAPSHWREATPPWKFMDATRPRETCAASLAPCWAMSSPPGLITDAGLEIPTPAIGWHSARHHQRKAWWDCWCSLLLNSLAAQLLTCLPECVGTIKVLQHFPTLIV